MNIVNISNCKPYVAEDKSVATEFVGPRNCNLRNFSVASITIPAGVTVKKHYHILSEETYQIIKGSGIMHLDGEERLISAGQAVAIKPGQWHSICNDTNLDLVMCVTCSPPWTMEDQIFE